jgi:hypothetical protein
VLCLQDIASDEAEEDVSLVFFELANAPFVSGYRYRIPILPKANEHEASVSA